MPQAPTTDPLYFLPQSGEMAALIRQKDWSQTPVGPPQGWPQSLRTTVGTLLACPFPMFLWWGPGLIQFYNDAYLPILGHSGRHPAGLGQPCADCWPEIWPLIGPMLNSVLHGGQSIWQENRLMTIYRNGQMEDVYGTFSYSPVLDESGQIAGVLAVCQETTRQVTKELEQQQQIVQSAALWKHVFEQVPVAVCIFRGPTFIIDLINDAQLEMVGRPGQNLLGQPAFEAIPEAAGQGLEQLLTGVLTTGEPVYANERGVQLLRNGQLQMGYFNLVYQALRDETDRIVGVVTVASEVTEQVLARQQVAQSEQLLNAMIQRTPVSFGVYSGADNVIERANPALAAIMNRTTEQMVNKPLLEAAPELQGQGFDELLNNVRETGEPFIGRELPAQLVRNGRLETGYFDFTYEPLPNPDGSIDRVMLVANEVTAQLLARQQLEASESQYRQLATELEERVRRRTQDLERSNLDLLQFASVASHDLKEPIRKVQTFGTLLRDQLADRMNADEEDLFRRLVDSSARMQTLISDVLRLSKFSDTTATFEPVDLNVVVHHILDDLELVMREREAEFRAGTLPTVQAEPAQMHQLLLNLVSNALKFQDGRTPLIRVEPVPLTGAIMTDLGLLNSHYAVVAVSDNGIGFDPKHKDRIFGMFQRLHGRSKYPGTGIGLTIVKKIIDNHRGYIDVQSQPGQGTTFRVALPLTPTLGL